MIREKLLFYDLMENDSLDHCLFNIKISTSMSWSEWYKIAVGISNGLTYLHEFSKSAMIQKDIKVS